MKHVHTMIEDPLQLRKEILESALDSTEALKSMDSLKGMDTDMAVFRKQLKAMIKTLRISATRFRQSLPELPTEFRELKRLDQETLRPQQALPAREQPELFVSNRGKFEQDLESIREKIKALQM